MHQSGVVSSYPCSSGSRALKSVTLRCGETDSRYVSSSLPSSHGSSQPGTSSGSSAPAASSSLSLSSAFGSSSSVMQELRPLRSELRADSVRGLTQGAVEAVVRRAQGDRCCSPRTGMNARGGGGLPLRNGFDADFFKVNLSAGDRVQLRAQSAGERVPCRAPRSLRARRARPDRSGRSRRGRASASAESI